MLKPCDLVLADEPTGSLNTTNADLVLAMLRALNAGGKTMIIVTHDDRVAAVCDRVVALPDPRSALELPEPGGRRRLDERTELGEGFRLVVSPAGF